MREETPITNQHTQCPHCSTIFAVSEEQLNALNGKVRCGYCYRTFNANETLLSQLNNPEPEETPPTLQLNVTKPDDDVLENINLAKLEYSADARLRLNQGQPQEAKSRLLANFAWGLAIAALFIAFIGQYAYFYRQDLLEKHRNLRPLFTELCTYLPCPPTLIKDSKLLKLISHDMRSLADNPQTLRVKGIFVNQADFAQPYPIVRLTLTDFNGKNSHRDFTSEQYLTDSQPRTGSLSAQAQMEIQLDIVDSNRNIVGFSLEVL